MGTLRSRLPRRRGDVGRGRAIAATVVLVGALLAAVVANATPAFAASVPVVSAGASHTCALMPSTQVLCWGNNTYGQLGNGTTNSSTVPAGPVVGLPPVTALTAGEFTSCAVDTAGRAWCWGNNQTGAIGNGANTDSPIPLPVAGGHVFTQIASGGITYATTPTSTLADFTCGVTKTGGVYCWGYGGDGQLGNGANANSNIPVQVTRLGAKAVQVATGANHACALLVDGTVVCWGFNAQGELGNNTKTSSNLPVVAIGVAGAVQVGAGVYNSCALLTAGSILCWGVNTRGELGNGTVVNSKIALPVMGLAGAATQISTGGHHTCAIVNVIGQVEVECWGEGQAGELGNGSYAIGPNPVPIPVFGLTGSPAGGSGVLPVQVAAGESTGTCAVIITGQVFCWGSNAKGQIGDGTKSDRALPTLVLGITTGPQQVSEGGLGGCAINQALGLSCWGSADGNDFGSHTSAQAVSTLPAGVAQVSGGEEGACALATVGKLRCWGENGSGEVGNNSTTPHPTPVGVTGMSSGIGAVASGDGATCAYMASAPKNALSCWGWNGAGQLGNSSTSDSPVPVTVPLLATQVANGGEHTCAISTNGNAYCWGANHFGQLGDGTTNDHHKPVQVSGLAAAPIQIASGGSFIGGTDLGDFTCALLVTGAVQCWGFGGEGALGNGSFADSGTPVTVNLSGPAKEVVTGAYHACALLTTGAVQCWGADAFGMLGDGGSLDEANPVNVVGLAQVLQISSIASNDTCALRSTTPQSVMCWGDNGGDQLGDGVSGGTSNTPQAVVGL